MKELREKQKEFIQDQYQLALSYITSHLTPNPKINAVLLSGSLASGTYMPGQYGGAIDLTLIVEDKSRFDCRENLGDCADREVPEYLIAHHGIYFQFVIYDVSLFSRFGELTEPRKYALLESKTILDRDHRWTDFSHGELPVIMNNELKEFYDRSKASSLYFINQYKVDRWKNREASPQLHANLSKSLEHYLRCLFYLNHRYCPADDRALYFSFDLPRLPEDYETSITEVMKIQEMSELDYLRREQIYRDRLLSYLV